MARPSNGSYFNISQLERILQERRGDLTRLERQRSDLQRKLDGVERQIAKLGGSLRGGRRGAGGRARNEQSLVAVLESVLGNGKPMKVGDIVDAVTAGGYRSNSANFRGIVNQTLIKERKRFAPVDRGVYQLKGESAKGSKKEKSAA